VHHHALGKTRGGLAVDLRDHVLALEPGILGRRVLHDRDDLHAVLDHANANADAAESVPAGAVLARALASGVAGEAVEFRDHAAEHGFVDRLGFGHAQRLGAVANFLDGVRRQSAPAVHVVGMRGVELAGRPAVDFQGHQVVAVGDADRGIEIRQAVKSRQGEFGGLEVLDIDVDHVLITGAENPRGARRIVVS
jgi:hypothetical protein